MEIKIVETPAPAMIEFDPMVDEKDFMMAIYEHGKVMVDTHHHTYSTISVSVGIAGFRFSYNPINSKYKQLIKQRTNMFSGGSSTVGYFKITKKQGYHQLMAYIKDSIRTLVRELPLNEITVEVWQTKAIRQLKTVAPVKEQLF